MQEAVEHPAELLLLQGADRAVFGGQAALQLLEGHRQVAAALGGAVIVALVQGQAAGDGGDVRCQRPRTLRWDSVPQTEPHVADALLRVTVVRQDVPGGGKAALFVFLLRGADGLRVAAEKMIYDLSVLHRALPFLCVSVRPS